MKKKIKWLLQGIIDALTLIFALVNFRIANTFWIPFILILLIIIDIILTPILIYS